jgi:hypothetical protein
LPAIHPTSDIYADYIKTQKLNTKATNNPISKCANELETFQDKK